MLEDTERHEKKILQGDRRTAFSPRSVLVYSELANVFPDIGKLGWRKVCYLDNRGCPPALVKLIEDGATSSIVFICVREFCFNSVLVELMFSLDSCICEQSKSCRRVVCRNWVHSGLSGTQGRMVDRTGQKGEDRTIAETLDSFQVHRLMDDGALISKKCAVARLSPRMYCRETYLYLTAGFCHICASVSIHTLQLVIIYLVSYFPEYVGPRSLCV